MDEHKAYVVAGYVIEAILVALIVYALLEGR